VHGKPNHRFRPRADRPLLDRYRILPLGEDAKSSLRRIPAHRLPENSSQQNTIPALPHRVQINRNIQVLVPDHIFQLSHTHRPSADHACLGVPLRQGQKEPLLALQDGGHSQSGPIQFFEVLHQCFRGVHVCHLHSHSTFDPLVRFGRNRGHCCHHIPKFIFQEKGQKQFR